MNAPTMQLAGLGQVSTFPKASRPQPCASPWECADVQPGEPGAYVGVDGGVVVVCGPCGERIRAEMAGQPAPAVEQPAPAVEAPQQDGPMPSDSYLPEGQPRTTLSARVVADQARTCWYKPGECGGVLEGFEAAWVQRTRPPAQVCGPCADEIESVEHNGPAAPASAVASITGPGEVMNDGAPSVPHQPDPTEAYESDADRAADGAHAEWVADQDEVPGCELAGGVGPVEPVLDVHECECSRVTKRAKFGRTSDGRPTHEHCGGVLREKHRHLAPTPETEQDTDQGEAHPDDRDAGDGPAAGSGSGAGDEARPAHGAAGAGEGGGEGGSGAGEGDHGRDQGGVGEVGTGRVDGGDPAQPAHDDAVEVRGGDEHAAGHRPAASGRAGGDAGAVHEDGHELASRPHDLSVPGWYAAFLAQPADDEPPFTLADFLGQPSEDETVGWAAPVNAPDSDNYLGEFSVAELLAEVASRTNYRGAVAAIVFDHGTLVEVPR